MSPLKLDESNQDIEQSFDPRTDVSADAKFLKDRILLWVVLIPLILVLLWIVSR